MTSLYILNGPCTGQIFKLQGETVYIGRSAESDVQVRDEFVSRKHLKIWRRGEKYYIEDLKSKHGTFINGEQIKPGIETELPEGLPIVIGMSVICVGEGCSEHVTAFLDSIDDAWLSKEDAAAAYEGRPLTTKRNMELLYRVTDTLSQSLDIREILERILDSVFDLLFRVDRAAIIILDPETGNTIDVISRVREVVEESAAPYSQEVVDQVRRERQAVAVSDSHTEEKGDLPDTLKLSKIRSVMCIPLISRSRVRGAIYVDSVTRPYGFREEDLSLLSSVSGPVAMAIENAGRFSGSGWR
ncbi:MAG: FHA domain-containing protein, partial [Pseudomonadota bacterium]